MGRECKRCNLVFKECIGWNYCPYCGKIIFITELPKSQKKLLEGVSEEAER